MNPVIHSLSKSSLIEACRRLGIKTGDTARNDKGYYVSALAAADPASVEAALAGLTVQRAFVPIGTAPAPVPAVAANLIGAVPAVKAETEQPKITGRKTAKQLFGINLTLLDGTPVECDVWDDPDAPDVDPLFRFNKATLAPVLAAINGGMNTWLAGPKGTGKTELVLQIAARLGRSVCRVNFDASTEKYEFLGGERIRGGQSVWQDGAVLLGMRRAGCIILLDEIARARSEYLISLNPLLEPRGRVTITETGEVVTKAPGVVFIAADNSNGTGDPTGNYVCRRMDASTVDRFDFTVEVGYPAPDIEAQIVVDRTGCNPDLAVELVKFVGVCRVSASAGNLEDAPGLRNLFAMTRAILAGIPVKGAYEAAIVAKAGIESREELMQLFKQNIDPDRVIAAAKGELAAFEALAEAAKAAAAASAAAPRAAAACPVCGNVHSLDTCPSCGYVGAMY